MKLIRVRARWLCLTSTLFLVAVASLAAARDRDPNAPVSPLAKERVQVAQKLYFATQAAYEAQTVTLPQLIDARRELQAAELELTDQVGAIKVLKKHMGLASQVEKKIEVLFKAGGVGGEAEKYLAARLDRVKVELELERAVKSAQVKEQ